jgi:hypothetical protein
LKCTARDEAVKIGISHATLEIEALGEACEMDEKL